MGWFLWRKAMLPNAHCVPLNSSISAIKERISGVINMDVIFIITPKYTHFQICRTDSQPRGQGFFWTFQSASALFLCDKNLT